MLRINTFFKSLDVKRESERRMRDERNANAFINMFESFRAAIMTRPWGGCCCCCYGVQIINRCGTTNDNKCGTLFFLSCFIVIFLYSFSVVVDPTYFSVLWLFLGAQHSLSTSQWSSKVSSQETPCVQFLLLLAQVELSLDSMSCRLLYKLQLPSRRRE